MDGYVEDTLKIYLAGKAVVFPPRLGLYCKSSVRLGVSGAMTPAQCRAARKLLGWGRERLGARSETSTHVIRTFELTGREQRSMTRPSEIGRIAAVRAALEAAGVEFTDGDAPGVWLRPSKEV